MDNQNTHRKNIFKCTNIGSSVNLDTNRNMENNTETAVTIDPNFVIQTVLDDKLDSTGAKLLSNSQHRLIKTLKDKDEK
jgi:hypothetical protein